MLFEVGVSKALQNFAEPSLKCLEVEADIIYIIYIKDRLLLDSIFTQMHMFTRLNYFCFVLSTTSCYFCTTIDGDNCSNDQNPSLQNTSFPAM